MVLYLRVSMVTELDSESDFGIPPSDDPEGNQNKTIF